MGYGGHLLWTAAIRTMHLVDGRRCLVARLPMPSDLARGVLYDRGATLMDDEVFRRNPRLLFTPARRKGPVSRLVDAAAARLLQVHWLRVPYEALVWRMTTLATRGKPYRLIHVDMRRYSYAARVTRRRMIWRNGGHAVDGMLRAFGQLPGPRDCELFFSSDERGGVDELLARHGLSRYLVVEPHTTTRWFGTLRRWPFANWQALVDALQRARPDLQIVQIGMDAGERLSGAVDLCGHTSFREAALVIKGAELFVGTDGGLMHAANAVGTRSVILWSGLNRPELLGYPERHRIIAKDVPCAPCGNLGWCDEGHKCMNLIAPSEVLRAVLQQLPDAARSPRPGKEVCP